MPPIGESGPSQMASFPESDFQICPLCKEMCGSPAPLSSNSSTSSSSSQTSSSSGGGGGSSCGGPPRRLHVLPCLHAFCRQCLEAQRHPGAGDALKLRCPICDQKVVISEPSGMDALPSSNFLLSNLLDVVVVAAAADEQKNGRAAGAGPAAGSGAGGGGGGNNRHHGRPPPGPPRAAGSSPAAAASAAPSSTSSSSSSSGGGGGSAALLLRRPHSRQGEPRCSSCDEGNAASSRCLDCQEHLCDNCVRAHQRVRLTKDHFIERFAAGPAAAGPAAPLALSPPYPASPYNILSVFPDRASYCQHHDDEVSAVREGGKEGRGGRAPAPGRRQRAPARPACCRGAVGAARCSCRPRGWHRAQPEREPLARRGRALGAPRSHRAPLRAAAPEQEEEEVSRGGPSERCGIRCPRRRPAEPRCARERFAAGALSCCGRCAPQRGLYRGVAGPWKCERKVRRPPEPH